MNRIALLMIAHVLCATLHLSAQFVLITSLYNETNPHRIREYITCLKCNLKHADISTIHILYDTTGTDDTRSGVIWDFIHNNPRIVVEEIEGRPSFGYCFSLANVLYPNQTIILTNADIFFNKSLNILKTIDMTNRFFALTRWNVTSQATLTPYLSNKGKRRVDSNDTWIFKTPLIAIQADDILLGTQHCDIYLAHRALQTNLQVYNPCLSIQCAHLHLSNIRHYPKVKTTKPYACLPWCSLADIL